MIVPIGPSGDFKAQPRTLPATTGTAISWATLPRPLGYAALDQLLGSGLPGNRGWPNSFPSC
eukprot:2627274-Alexandrium_andersonii.AAC.1